ncbi:MAG: cytochrome c4 [Pseudomonadota bacterium]|nr:cytochrome c4 [Pseudomonadota bacterium]
MQAAHAAGLLSLALLGLAASVRAQDAMPRQPVATAALVTQVCAACHGVDGNSTRPDVPSLAEQVQPYLEGQLRAFAAQGGQRANGVMGAIAVNLSADEMKRVAVYFARQRLRPAAPGEVSRSDLDRGERIFFTGLPAKGVASCASCHGARGEGLPDLFPRLAGQGERYIAEQLHNFRAGTRTSDPRAMMRSLAGHLSDRDIDVVSKYVSLLR